MVWKVLLGLALLLAFLLFVPLRVQVLFRQGEVTARLRVLFLNVPLFPTPSGKEKAGRPKPAQGRPETEKKEKPKRNTLEFILDILRLINDLLPHAGRGLGHILRRVTLSRCRVSVTVAQEDAADTALRYGQSTPHFTVFTPCCAAPSASGSSASPSPLITWGARRRPTPTWSCASAPPPSSAAG